MNFIKLRSMELKQSVVSHFCIKSCENNMVIENQTAEAIILRLNNEPDIAENFPYALESVNVPQDLFATKLLRGINMRRIYENSRTQEQQEFGLDPLFVAECSIEPTKPRLLQAEYAPTTTGKPMLAVISTYGDCHIMSKNIYDRIWKEQIGNLTKMLMTEIFPTNKVPTDITTFSELKAFVNLYVTTACSWHNNGKVIYTANASGFIFAFKVEYKNVNEDTTESINWKFVSHISTKLGRISYLKSFGDYLIGVSTNGIIQLFEFVKKGTEKLGELTELQILWNQRDQMSCRQIEVQEDNGGYMILCAKAASVICIRISKAGKMEGFTHLNVPGIKITGLELFHENELIVTTITGNVLRITFSCILEENSSSSLRLKADSVSIPNMDSENVQILGVGSSINKALWVFLTYRNKEQYTSSKQIFSSYLILCKPSTIDPLGQLSNIPIDTMNPYQDIILSLRMDIWQINLAEKYNQHLQFFSQIAKQKNFDDIFLRKVQTQLEIVRSVSRRSNFKLQIINEVISSEIQYLEFSTQLIHILLRLEYLQGLIDNKRLIDASASLDNITDFQRKAVHSLRKNFFILLENLKRSCREFSKKDAITKLKDTMLDFVELITQNLRLKCPDFEILDNPDSREKCLSCNHDLNEHEIMCELGHNMPRCCVSFVQVPWFNNRYCAQCGTVALENNNSNDSLTELFPANESVKCTFCRFSFTSNEVV